MTTSNLTKRPEVVRVDCTDEWLTADLADGRRISVPLAWYPRLAHGTPEERGQYEIFGGGYGIHWPDLDEDLHVDGLLEGRRSGESDRSFQRWLESRRHRKSS